MKGTTIGVKYAKSNTPTEIQVRFQYKPNIVQGKKFGEQMKYILHDIMQCVKDIDNIARLVTWNTKDTEVDLDGKELLFISQETIKNMMTVQQASQNTH